MFKCDCCGECCKHIDVKELMIPGTTVCKYLTKDNKCSIYDHRPLICNIDKGYELFKDTWSLEEWYEINYTACKKLKDMKEDK